MADTENIVPWLEFAVKLEVRGEKFYKEALASVSHPRAKQLFEYLVTAEQKHKAYLEKMLEGAKSGGTTGIKAALEGVEGFDSDKGHPIFPEETLEKIKSGAAVTEMFNAAIKAERLSIELYLELSESHPDMKEFFRKLSTEELGHKKALEGMGMEVFGMNFSDEEETETIDDYKPKPVVEVDLIGEGNKFNPNPIEIDEGSKLVLKMVGKDTNYGIVCPTYGIKEFLPKGKVVIEEIFPDQPGEFHFFNNVPSGEGWRDMKGIIKVRETPEGKKKRDAKPDDDLFG